MMKKKLSKRNTRRGNKKLKGGNMKKIDVNEVDKLEIPSETTVHLKGFAGGLDIDENYEVAKSKLFDDLKEKYVRGELTHLVWDGDEYANKSFTHLLPEFHQRFPEVKLIAFAKLIHLSPYTDDWGPNEGRMKNWESHNLPITWVTCPESLGWDELGSLALGITGSHNVLLVGGGDTVVTEYVRCLLELDIAGVRCSQPVEFKCYPFTRNGGEKGFLCDSDKIMNKIKKLGGSFVTRV